MVDGPLGFALEWLLVAALMFAAGLPHVRAWFASYTSEAGSKTSVGFTTNVTASSEASYPEALAVTVAV